MKTLPPPSTAAIFRISRRSVASRWSRHRRFPTPTHPRVLHDQKLIDAAFKLDMGQVRAIPGEKGAPPYLVKLIALEPQHVPPLKDIESEVRAAYIRANAESQAHAKAADLLKQIKSADDFDKVAEANKLTIHHTDAFPRSSESVPDLGSFPEVTDAAGVVAKIPGVIDRVMENKGDAYIFEVTDRSAPTAEDWKTAQKDFTDEFVQQRRAEAWTRFIEALKSRAKITVDATQFAQSGPAGPLDNDLDYESAGRTFRAAESRYLGILLRGLRPERAAHPRPDRHPIRDAVSRGATRRGRNPGAGSPARGSCYGARGSRRGDLRQLVRKRGARLRRTARLR